MMKVANIFAILLSLANSPSFAQRSCGIEAEKAALIAMDPGWAQKFEQQRASLQEVADHYMLYVGGQTGKIAERNSSSIAAIPVVFHIVVDTQQYINMGSAAGIQERVDSQMAVLNRDYNRQNPDSGMIPALWKPLFGSVGIHFGLAHTDPNGARTPGYEVKFTNHHFTVGPYENYSDARNAPNGLPAWDNTKFMNVWCIYFYDSPTLLGVTTPKSFTGQGGIPVTDEGICINYLSLGSQNKSNSLAFPQNGNYTEGRSLTHEVGHFFEIWHTWGDDGGLCPWAVSSSCSNRGPGPGGSGSDDGLDDTPPEGDAHYGNPAYTITGGTLNDCCSDSGSVNKQPIGIASLSFLNYVDDNAMHLFTPQQAAAIASMALVPSSTVIGMTGSGLVGENFSLTQHPQLLEYPITPIISNLLVFPNPSLDVVYIKFDSTGDELNQVTVTNILGQVARIFDVPASMQDYYSIDLSGLGKGIYFIRCNFATGSVTRKILLQ